MVTCFHRAESNPVPFVVLDGSALAFYLCLLLSSSSALGPVEKLQDQPQMAHIRPQVAAK